MILLILELFQQNYSQLKNVVSSYSSSDEETHATISKVFKQHSYLLDPHGAVGYNALEKYLDIHHKQKGFFLETAHPVKFNNVVEENTKEPVAVPDSIKDLLNKKKQSVVLKADYEQLKSFLMST